MARPPQAAAPKTRAADLPALLQQALGLHQRGQLAAAEAIYRRMLSVAPKHFNALHLLGIIHSQRGEHAAAVELIGRSLRVNDRDPGAHANLALALLQSGQFAAAAESYGRAATLAPANAEAQLGRANALRLAGRLAEALAAYTQALALRPDLVEAELRRGDTLLLLQRPDAALACYERVLAWQPDSVDAIANRGVALLRLKRPDAALASFDRALELRPDQASVLSNRGNALVDLGRPAEALTSCEQALALAPDLFEAHNNRGNALLDLCRPAEALASYEQALALRPDHAGALTHRGLALQALGRHEAALGDYAQARRLAADDPAPALYEGYCRLLLGDLAGGWPLHEFRWIEAQAHYRRDFGRPQWCGDSPLAGRTILIHAEQGLGDSLQFCRYVPLVAGLGATVLLEVPHPLRTCLAGLPGVAQFLIEGEALPEFDLHCPLLSLPLAFGTTLANIPASVPYLAAEPARVAAWAARLGPQRRPRVGLVWAGNPRQVNDHNRSLPLAQALGLLDPAVELIGLQRDLRPGDRALLAAHPELRHLGDDLDDLADTAAVLESLDLVVTVCTSVAHLAGALGRPVWLMLPFNPDWRWLLGRDDSPWYPSARLFRQPAVGDWDSVVAALRQTLRERFGGD